MRACFKNVNTIPASIPVSLHKVDRPVMVRCGVSRWPASASTRALTPGQAYYV